MGRNARRRTVSQYDWSQIVPQLMHHYASLFAAHRHVEFGVGSSYAPD